MRKQLESAAAQLETLAATVRHQSSPVAVAATVAAGFGTIAATLRAGLARVDEMEREAAAALASLPPEVRERIEGMLSEVLAPAGAEPCGLCGATDNAPCEDCGRNAPGAPE